MVNYSIDTDLIKFRPNILNNGAYDTSWAHDEAYSLINTTLEAEWYMKEAPNHDVDPATTAMNVAKLRATQFKYLSVYKALELIYVSLTKDTPLDDGFYAWAAHFRKEYDNELQKILKIGVEYDWDATGTITQAEKYIPQRRNLEKC